MGTTVAVAGASGYAGGEALRLLAAHPEVRLGALTAGSASSGQPLAALHPHLLPVLGDRVVGPTDPAVLAEADAVVLALPHGQSAAVAAALPDDVLVVDLGADHRLADPAAWRRWYGEEHPHAGTWPYGLPELPGQRERLAGATRVAVPGCYPTAVSLAVAPLLAAGLVARDDVVAVACSGTSGAGTSPSRRLLGSEVMGDTSAYGVASHRHTPELLQALGLPHVSFTPVLVPMPRGMLATVTAPLAAGATTQLLREALAAAYDPEPLVHLLPEGQWPHTSAVLGSACAHVQVVADPDAGRAVAVCAIDNLGKGAAAAGVQVLNLLLGLPETTGLPLTGVAP